MSDYTLFSSFKNAVAGRRIRNKAFETIAKIHLVHRIYSDRPEQLKRILDGDHPVYELIGEAEVLEKKMKLTAQEKLDAKRKFRAALAPAPIYDSGILKIDKMLDPPTGEYVVDEKVDREWNRRKAAASKFDR